MVRISHLSDHGAPPEKKHEMITICTFLLYSIHLDSWWVREHPQSRVQKIDIALPRSNSDILWV